MAKSVDLLVRRWPVLLGLAITVFLVDGWMDRSSEDRVDLAPTGRILVISDAGPIVVKSGPTNSLKHSDSWLFSRPGLEVSERPDETIVRSRCSGFSPCRSTLELTVTPGIELVVVAAEEGAHIEHFDGRFTVFSSSEHGLVTLGPITGTGRVVAAGGSVEGFGLHLDQLDVEVLGARVMLQFAEVPTAVNVRGGRAATSLRLPAGDYDLGISSPRAVSIGFDSVPGAASTVTVVSDGVVDIREADL